jgi:cell wall-associated NlpC family hydrolase
MTSLRDLLASVGFHGKGLDTAVAVSMAESGGHPTSHNTNAGTGDNSYGLFQINMLGDLGPERMREYHLSSYNQLFDPATNARVAYQLSNGGTNWTPWTTYTRGTYLKYLGQDMQIGGPLADPNAATSDDTVDTSGSTDHAAAGHADAFDISTGQSLTELSANQTQLQSQFDTAIGQTTSAHPTLTAVTHTETGTMHSGLAPNDDALHTFLSAAQGELGESYVFGAKADADVAHPSALDCSGLTKWAAERAGAHLPDGAGYQYLALKKEGMLIPVKEALHTPGALLFHFAHEPVPGEGEPAIAHVAISKGNGMTIEAADPQDGVVSWKAEGRFNYAALIPGIATTDPADMAHDALPMHSSDGLTDFGDDGSTVGVHDGHSVLDDQSTLGHGLGAPNPMQEGLEFDDHYLGLDAGHH